MSPARRRAWPRLCVAMTIFDAIAGDGGDDVFDGFGCCRIEAGGGFVEEEQVWLQGEGARQCQPLLFAAGEFTCRAVFQMQELDAVEQAGNGDVIRRAMRGLKCEGNVCRCGPA